jgi:pimeloyl-ACP methyl ester carboxylesterase
VIVDGLPMFHRSSRGDDQGRTQIVHVHGFGISGSYLEPTAARLASKYPTYVPDLPGMGRSISPVRTLDLPGLARALIAYCDEVGIERATFVGNSLGCPIIIEVASRFPDRIERAVLVSPAGGPNNQPMARALKQMMLDGPREELSMIPIAARDYLRFGVMRSWALFQAMIAYPTLERLRDLAVPTLVIAGHRDPLVNFDRVGVFSGLAGIDVVKVQGAHALNYSHPEIIAALIDAHIEGRPLVAPPGSTDVVERVVVPSQPVADNG